MRGGVSVAADQSVFQKKPNITIIFLPFRGRSAAFLAAAGIGNQQRGAAGYRHTPALIAHRSHRSSLTESNRA